MWRPGLLEQRSRVLSHPDISQRGIGKIRRVDVGGPGWARRRIFHRSPRLISAHAGAPDSQTQSIFTGIIFSSGVRGARVPRQGGCVTAHTGCPPDDRSFPSFNLSLSSKLSRIPSSCRASVSPRRTASLTGREETLSLSLSPPEKETLEA